MITDRGCDVFYADDDVYRETDFYGRALFDYDLDSDFYFVVSFDYHFDFSSDFYSGFCSGSD